jgi:hypothetical protein
MLVAHTRNPRYSVGRDQEDGGSKPAQANSLETLSQKTPSQNILNIHTLGSQKERAE